MAAGWFAAALLPAVFGSWLAVDTFYVGISIACLCLAHAAFEFSRFANFSSTSLSPFTGRCVTQKRCLEFFGRRAEWESQTAA